MAKGLASVSKPRTAQNLRSYPHRLTKAARGSMKSRGSFFYVKHSRLVLFA